MPINENTVSAENQTVNSSELYYLGNEHAKTRILVVGNSITRHGPKKDIGWEYDWGMAASAPEKDYVHRLFSMLKKDGQDVYMRIRQCSFWETHFAERNMLSNYDDDRAFRANIVIYRLGENVAESDKPFFRENAEKFIRHISGKGKVIMTTCFWKNEIVDDGIRSMAEENGYSLIELGDLGDDPEMKATGLFWHSGVAAHPGDKGMEEIAERIYKILKKQLYSYNGNRSYI